VPTKKGKAKQLVKKGEIEALNGSVLMFSKDGDMTMVNDSTIIREDVFGAKKTSLQTIDTVLIPAQTTE
jgi:uncharacterized surface protein with fasciclin (FAS1) repeats